TAEVAVLKIYVKSGQTAVYKKFSKWKHCCIFRSKVATDSAAKWATRSGAKWARHCAAKWATDSDLNWATFISTTE
ncbi:hypothetical protein DRQ29_07450, partial [bacterium]